MATARCAWRLVATCMAMFSASAVLPIAGRAARMMSSPGRKPPVISSSLMKPVLTPRTRREGSRKLLMPPSAESNTCWALASVFLACASPMLSSFSSAAERICAGSSSAIMQRWIVSCEAAIILRSRLLSRTMLT